MRKKKGPLIIIGGREEIGEREKRVILQEVVSCASTRKQGLLVVTVATHLPEQIGADYVQAFQALGMKHVDVLDIRTRDQAFDQENLKKVANACAVYFT